MASTHQKQPAPSVAVSYEVCEIGSIVSVLLPVKDWQAERKNMNSMMNAKQFFVLILLAVLVKKINNKKEEMFKPGRFLNVIKELQ
jgi:hypothetical protein